MGREVGGAKAVIRIPHRCASLFNAWIPFIWQQDAHPWQQLGGLFPAQQFSILAFCLLSWPTNAAVFVWARMTMTLL